MDIAQLDASDAKVPPFESDLICNFAIILLHHYGSEDKNEYKRGPVMFHFTDENDRYEFAEF